MPATRAGSRRTAMVVTEPSIATGKLRGNCVAGVADTPSAEPTLAGASRRGVVAAEPVAAAATSCAGDCLAEPAGDAEVRACSASQRRAELTAAQSRGVQEGS